MSSMLVQAILLVAGLLQGCHCQDALSYYVNFGLNSLGTQWQQFSDVSSEGITVDITGVDENMFKKFDIERTPKTPNGDARYPVELYQNYLQLSDGALSITFTLTPSIEYTAIMHFIEPEWNSNRTFNILVNEYQLPDLEEFSIEELTNGAHRPFAAILDFGVMKTDILKITLETITAEAVLCGIEVFPTDSWRENAVQTEVELEEFDLAPAPGPTNGMPDFSTEYAVGTMDKTCWEAEDPFCGIGKFERASWSLEDYSGSSGCGLMRWGEPNVYQFDKIDQDPDIAICYTVNLAKAGDYEFSIVSIRNSFGRVEINCGESAPEKEADRQECQDAEGVECFCSDEENDIWSKVQGPHVEMGTPGDTWIKHMANCQLDSFCSQTKCNIDDELIPAVYTLEAGVQQVCIAARSERVGIDQVCLSYQGEGDPLEAMVPQPEGTQGEEPTPAEEGM